jgi:hypothetical protein
MVVAVTAWQQWQLGSGGSATAQRRWRWWWRQLGGGAAVAEVLRRRWWREQHCSGGLARWRQRWQQIGSGAVAAAGWRWWRQWWQWWQRNGSGSFAAQVAVVGAKCEYADNLADPNKQFGHSPLEVRARKVHAKGGRGRPVDKDGAEIRLTAEWKDGAGWKRPPRPQGWPRSQDTGVVRQPQTMPQHWQRP